MASVLNRVRLYKELVKFEHTIFALPFAYSGALLSADGIPSGEKLFWITIAMVAARNAAMGFNRLIDREIDAANPRTASRHLPRGLISIRNVKYFIGLSLLVLCYCVFRLSPGHLLYVPLLIFFLAGYSYTKRFTWLSHIVLGVTDGFAPVAGWIAVSQQAEPAAFILGGAVAFWIAGFDIIYAILDLDFDREYGLFSIPLRFGVKKGLFLAKAFHAMAVFLLLLLFYLTQLGAWFFCGVIITVLLLWYEHSLVSPQDLSRLNMAFFNMNGIISSVLFIFTLIDILLV